MFTKVVTHADGESATETSSDVHALRLLRTAVRRGYRVEATRTGGAIIERSVHDGVSIVPRTHTVTLEPVVPVGPISATVRECLSDIAAREAFRVDAAEPPFRHSVGRISAGLGGAPPAAAARLVARGLVVLGEPYRSTSNGYLPEVRTPVGVSLAARLAMHAQDHRTHTLEPAGYVRPNPRVTAGVQTPGGGLVYSRTSAAGCSCRNWSATGDGRDDARRLARRHRQQQTAEFIRALA
ncbi:hypothetical protein AB0N79_38690 [Streptomyces microflavus]|uniref:hypothetical protein n=1 Tax=Streptomyces microflavus TaxID=1919 RepID=UPI00225233C1|nr:hypothetical protein [Streptomyces microflavus]MCX4657298.1 hypothetical protein [Streptomyces microflavus]